MQRHPCLTRLLHTQETAPCLQCSIKGRYDFAEETCCELPARYITTSEVSRFRSCSHATMPKIKSIHSVTAPRLCPATTSFGLLRVLSVVLRNRRQQGSHQSKSGLSSSYVSYHFYHSTTNSVARWCWYFFDMGMCMWRKWPHTTR